MGHRGFTINEEIIIIIISFNTLISFCQILSVNDPSLTSWAAETFSLLPPFGVTEDVNDECGKLTSVETGKLLTALREEQRKSCWTSERHKKQTLACNFLNASIMKETDAVQPTVSGSLPV